jgi:hypothetical protein
MAFIGEHEQLTPRESVIMETESEERRLAREHALAMKRVEIEAQKLEVRWAAWLKLPALIIKLPLLILVGIGLVVALARKTDIPEEFWNIIKT